MSGSSAPVVTSSVARPYVVERWFYVGMAIATLIAVLLGFTPSLINTVGRKAPLTPFAAAHGVVSFAWLTLFLTQTTLVATRRISTHRRLGAWATLLAILLVILGYMTAITMARRGFDLSGDLHIESDPLLGMVNPLGDLIPFVILLGAGYWFRYRSDVHKRLMLLATVGGLMPAPLAHLIGHYPVLNSKPPIIVIPIAVFLFSSAVHDRFTLGRVHPVSLWVAAAVFAWDLLLNLAIGPSAGWHRFARWLIG